MKIISQNELIKLGGLSSEEFILRFFKKDRLRKALRKYPNARIIFLDIAKQELLKLNLDLKINLDSWKGARIQIIKM